MFAAILMHAFARNCGFKNDRVKEIPANNKNIRPQLESQVVEASVDQSYIVIFNIFYYTARWFLSWLESSLHWLTPFVIYLANEAPTW